MKREDIEKAANQCSFIETPDARERFLFRSGFKAGAKWRIDSVWHDIDERPKADKMIAVYIEKDYISVQYSFNGDMPRLFHALGAKYWAYIKDLIPNT